MRAVSSYWRQWAYANLKVFMSLKQQHSYSQYKKTCLMRNWDCFWSNNRLYFTKKKNIYLIEFCRVEIWQNTTSDSFIKLIFFDIFFQTKRVKSFWMNPIQLKSVSFLGFEYERKVEFFEGSFVKWWNNFYEKIRRDLDRK